MSVNLASASEAGLMTSGVGETVWADVRRPVRLFPVGLLFLVCWRPARLDWDLDVSWSLPPRSSVVDFSSSCSCSVDLSSCDAADLTNWHTRPVFQPLLHVGLDVSTQNLVTGPSSHVGWAGRLNTEPCYRCILSRSLG